MPAGMPADYELLMRQCWTAEPGERPSITAVLQCLEAMIAEREKAVGIRRRSSSSSQTARPPGETPTAAGAAAAATTAAAAAPSSKVLTALVTLLQPQDSQVQAILQQQEQHQQWRERVSAEGLDPVSARLSTIAASSLFADNSQSHAVEPVADGGAAGHSSNTTERLMVIGDQPGQQQQPVSKPAARSVPSSPTGVKAAAGVSKAALVPRPAGGVLHRTPRAAGGDAGEEPVLDIDSSAHGGNRLWFV